MEISDRLVPLVRKEIVVMKVFMAWMENLDKKVSNKVIIC